MDNIDKYTEAQRAILKQLEENSTAAQLAVDEAEAEWLKEFRRVVGERTRREEARARLAAEEDARLAAEKAARLVAKEKEKAKGVEANDESGHWSEGGLSDDVIMRDAETTVSTSLLAFTRKLKTILAREKRQGTLETPP
jgi:hypothetical protein